MAANSPVGDLNIYPSNNRHIFRASNFLQWRIGATKSFHYYSFSTNNEHSNDRCNNDSTTIQWYSKSKAKSKTVTMATQETQDTVGDLLRSNFPRYDQDEGGLKTS